MNIKLNPDNVIFWNGCKNKKLIFQKCNNCGKIRWPYSIACNNCYSFDYELVESNGNGKIYSFTIFNVPFHKDFKDKVPYIVAIIELENRVKLVSNIVTEEHEKIFCGANVEVCWEKVDDSYIPLFKLQKT